MKTYSFIFEGPLGTNLEIKKAHQMKEYPTRGNSFKFHQNHQALRNKYANDLKSAHRISGLNGAKKTRNLLLNQTGRQIDKYVQKHGELTPGVDFERQ